MRTNRNGDLTKTEILSYMSPSRPVQERLFISPLLDTDQIGETSIDLHLSHSFSVPKPSRLGLLDIIELHNDGAGALSENYNDSHVPYGQYFTLHPRRSVQIGTLEYVGLPMGLKGMVTLRASASNLPLLCNAAQVHPGHRGVISLTLTSNAEFSIKLYPGLRIAELSLRYVASQIKEHNPSRYHYMIKPVPTELYKDKELAYLGPMVEPIIIGIASTIAAGRTTALDHLTERHGFTAFSLAQILKTEAIKAGIPLLRGNLQDFGSNLRETRGDGYLAVKLRTSAQWLTNKNTLVIVDSFKHIAEIEEFRKQKRFVLIGIDAPLLERWKRVQSRRRQGDPSDFDGFREQDKVDRGENTASAHAQQVQELLRQADYEIVNDGTIGKFIEKLDEVVSDIVGVTQ